MSTFIGVIRSADTGQIFAVVNPDDDSELDNPRLLLLKRTGHSEGIEMIKVPREEYERLTSRDGLDELVDRYA